MQPIVKRNYIVQKVQHMLIVFIWILMIIGIMYLNLLI